MTFDGGDPAFVIHFLFSVTDLLDQRGYNEALAFNFLPRLLRGEAKVSYEAARTASSTSARPVNNWPSAVNYLLEVYAQYRHLKAAEADLRKVKQSTRETESQYFARFERAHLRSGSILDNRERTVAYVDGLDEAIRENILLFMQDNPNAGIVAISQRALHEGNLWRHRSGLLKKLTSKVMAVEEVDDDDEPDDVYAMQTVPGIGYKQPGWQKRAEGRNRPRRLPTFARIAIGGGKINSYPKGAAATHAALP